MIGHKSPQQPQKLQIAPGLALEPTARLHAIEIAVDIELQENRGVEGGPPSCCRLDTVEPEVGEIERIDEGVDGANRIVLVDPIIEALRQKCRLSPICSLDEPLHDHPRRIIRGIITTPVFSHTQGHLLPSCSLVQHVWFTPKNGNASELCTMENRCLSDVQRSSASGRGSPRLGEPWH